MAVSASSLFGVTVQTRTAFRFELMMSEMCGRRLFGACALKAASVDGTESGPAVKAMVSTFPVAEVARMPPWSAKPAMKPIFDGLVVTPLNPLLLKQGADNCAVNGFELRTPQPAATSATRSASPSQRATRRL